MSDEYQIYWEGWTRQYVARPKDWAPGDPRGGVGKTPDEAKEDLARQMKQASPS